MSLRTPSKFVAFKSTAKSGWFPFFSMTTALRTERDPTEADDADRASRLKRNKESGIRIEDMDVYREIGSI